VRSIIRKEDKELEAFKRRDSMESEDDEDKIDAIENIEI